MGELLYKEWLEEEVSDLQCALITVGVHGMLYEFEAWLDRNGYLKRS